MRQAGKEMLLPVLCTAGIPAGTHLLAGVVCKRNCYRHEYLNFLPMGIKPNSTSQFQGESG